MYFPKFPEPEDTIGICAPSAGVGGEKLSSFEKSLLSFAERGYIIRETESVRNEGIRSSEAERRGEEFNALAADETISAVISATGGDFNIEMLPYIDWKSIDKHPKWYAGYSDPTNYLYTITTKLDIATIYGFNAGSFDSRSLDKAQTNALSIFSGNIVRQDSFEKHFTPGDFEATEPSCEVYWDLFNSDSLDVKGRMIGGCLDVIARLIGTEYDGTPDFTKRYKDLIWFFDVYECKAEDLYRIMLQFKYAGYFKNAKAVIFGRIMFPDSTGDKYTELIKKALDIPFIWNADIGHVHPSMTIINGSFARVRCANGKGSIEMSLE